MSTPTIHRRRCQPERSAGPQLTRLVSRTPIPLVGAALRRHLGSLFHELRFSNHDSRLSCGTAIPGCALRFPCLRSGGSLDPCLSLRRDPNELEGAPPLVSKGGPLPSYATTSLLFAFLVAPSGLSAFLRYLLSRVSLLRSFQLSAFNFQLSLEVRP